MPAFFFLLLWSAGSAVAGGIIINPVRVMIFPGKNSASTKVTNETNRAILFQVEPLLWQQTVEGDNLTQTSDIIAVPPVFSLAAGKSQTVRIALRRPADPDNELTYRIYITEVPDETRRHEGILSRLRFSIPIFVSPKKRVKTSESWSVQRTGERSMQITFDNTGNAHILFSKVRIVTDDGAAVVLHEADLASYVLAGRTRSWSLNLDKPLPSRSIILKADSDSGTHEVKLSLGSP